MESKKAQVNMLPTEDKTDIIVPSKGVGKNVIHLKEYYGNADISMGDSYQHLYFTINEEIKEGDWFISSLDGKPWCQDGTRVVNDYTTAQLFNMTVWDKKIIATTDKSLRHRCDCCEGTGIIEEESCRNCIGGNIGYLPQPSQTFIKEYCKLEGIDEVLVKYDLLIAHNSQGSSIKQLDLKVDSQNTIDIIPIKNSFSLEEVINISLSAFATGQLYETKYNKETGYKQKYSFYSWKKKHLNY